jgi:hypothetical protein
MEVNMRIGAISFQPYVYNVNAISPASMNKLSRISDNVLDKKTDFSGLAENENPLKRGQTLNFQDMLEMQMQRGRSAAARMIKPAQAAQEKGGAEAAQTQDEAVKFNRENAVNVVRTEQETADSAQNVQTAAFDGSGAENGVSNFRMQQAISAYAMFMTA